MAITATGHDPDGAAIDTKITAISTAITNAPAGSNQLVASQKALDQAQQDAVRHYISTGRVHPGAVLSVLGVSAANIINNRGQGGDNTLAARITTLTTNAATAGPSQADARQRLLAAQNECVEILMQQKVISAATILSSLS